VRIDKEKVDGLEEGLVAKMADYVRGVIKEVDAVIVEDYGKGVISPKLLRRVIPLARAAGKVIAVDPKEEHFRYYKGVTLITPNNHEASKAVGFSISDSRTLEKAGNALLNKLKCAIALITLGPDGMAVFQKKGPMRRIPTVAQEVFDVSGAGDTVIASYTLALVSGADPVEAAHIANCAAGIVVGKVGIAVVTPQELAARVKEEGRK
jgi:D-beta-D-heptose 7-phosphate kinase/D-beta-D-heptose 1-phosphate adenosyltransferase